MGHVNLLRAVQTPNALYTQLESGKFDNNPQWLMGMPAGATQPTFAAIAQMEHSISAETTQLKTLLTECDEVWGVDLSGGNVTMFLAAAANLGTRQGAGVHQAFRGEENCCMYYSNISAQQGPTPAKASVTWAPVWKGTSAAPMVQLGAQDLPANGGTNEYFGLSRVKINGTAVPGITGWTLDMGIDRKKISTDGAIYPAFSYTDSIAPTIQFQMVDFSVWETFGNSGTAITSIELMLQRYAPNGMYYATNASQHIKITATRGIVLPGSVSGGPKNHAQHQLTVKLVAEDEDTPIIALAHSQAFP